MRTMYDAVDASQLPEGGDFYCCYIDGRYANETAVRARFPNKRIIRIAVFASTLDGDVLDIESGNATPAEVPGWLTARRNAGANPTAYCNLSNHQAIIDAITAAGLPQPPYWIAHYTEVPHLEPGSIATQWHSGTGYDTSEVSDYWPGVDPAPNPTADEVVAVATSQVGTIASANNDTPYSDWYQLTWPLTGNDYRGENWCAMFVSWVWAHTAPPLGLHFAWVPTGVDAFKAYGLLDMAPRVGDAVFYDWNGDGTADHTGLVEFVDANDGVHTIEGNAGTPAGVYRHLIGPTGDRAFSDVLGYGHPVYAPAAAPGAPTPPPAPPTTLEVDVQLARTQVHVPLDANGNGWQIVNVPFANVVSVLMNGADPRTAGYVHVPVPSADGQGTQTQLEVQGGPANGAVDLFVWTAA